MPPLFNDSEIRQLLEDISADENLGGEGGGEADPRRVSVILGEIPSDPRRVSVIQVEKRCTAPGGWLDTATITSYALSLLQFPVYAVSTLIVIPLANISSKLVGEQNMQAAISILQRLAFLDAKEEPEIEGCGTLLRDLILSQEKTMFYTMTMATNTPINKEVVKKPLPNLKWKCALSLSRSQTVIHRTNTNSPSYYTFTYLGDIDVDNNSSSPTTRSSITKDKLRPMLKKRSDPSPVKIYINS